MVTHMKTTIDIADPLIGEIKQIAAREGVTLRQLVEEGLRLVLERRSQPVDIFRLRDASVDGEGIRPGLVEGDWASLREAIYEGRGT